MKNTAPFRIKTITEGHRLIGLDMPKHPLISLVDVSQFKGHADVHAVIFDFYAISIKRGCNNLLYGQQKYDFDEGLMAFMSPGQVLRGEEGGRPEGLRGWMLFFHPDLLWKTPLAKKIKHYDFFGYASNEALFLSEKEELTIKDIIEKIRQEYDSNIDGFSQRIIVAHLETLLSYAERFYNRQFITRKKASNQLLGEMEDLLIEYFNGDDLVSRGLPSVQFLADELNVSSSYLSSLLKSLTGQTAQQHIHDKLIEKAKEKLSTSQLTVSEIAYQLGFEYSQSFSKLFKAKTRQTPLEFRQSFN
jgi:AraC-like DNA-binding protein